MRKQFSELDRHLSNFKEISPKGEVCWFMYRKNAEGIISGFHMSFSPKEYVEQRAYVALRLRLGRAQFRRMMTHKDTLPKEISLVY